MRDLRLSRLQTAVTTYRTVFPDLRVPVHEVLVGDAAQLTAPTWSGRDGER
jgi:hypothetical protein